MMQNNKLIKIATRNNRLAISEACFVKSKLEDLYPKLNIEIFSFKTKGDRMLEGVDEYADYRGLYTEELAERLIYNEVDLAVHAMKDMPMNIMPGLCIGAILEREVSLDCFVSNKYSSIYDLPEGAVVGASGPRRRAQILDLCKGKVKVVNLKGNIQSRIDKVDRKEFDAIIIGVSDLKFLNMQDRIMQTFTVDEMLPSACQGVIGIPCRKEEEYFINLLRPLHHKKTAACVLAERSLLQNLRVNINTPVAAFAEYKGQNICLKALVASIDGKKILRAELTANDDDPNSLGALVAEQLIKLGADKIIKECIRVR